MKATFGVDSCRLYGRWVVEGTGGSSVCEKNVLFSDSLSLGSVTLALSPDANTTATSFASVPASLTLLYSRGDDSEDTGMSATGISSAFETGCYITECHVTVLKP